MLQEKDYVYELETEVADLNEDNLLKPYGYQKIINQTHEKHLKGLHLGVDHTSVHNLAWVLVSLSFEIVKPVSGLSKLYANTWYSEQRGPYFRREYVFRNEKGEELFHSSGFTVMLDLKKRSIYRNKKLPFELMEASGHITMEASPTVKIHEAFSKVDERRIYNSHIDCLGHVNNCRYGEFAYDAFTDAERQNLGNLNRMDIYFLSELKNGDTFSILKACRDERMWIRGWNNSKDCGAFLISFDF